MRGAHSVRQNIRGAKGSFWLLRFRAAG